jgi:uncharacterized protein (DUF2132 family)
MNSDKPHQSKDPLHGVTLKMIVEQLVDYYGWEELADLIHIDCFYNNPSVKSSLNFLRKPTYLWARKKVESLYLDTDFDDLGDELTEEN